jgi:PAS domain S-box-containing protein
MREDEARYKSVIDGLLYGVVCHDNTGKIVYANEAASNILGLPLDVLQGKTSLDPDWHVVKEDGSSYSGEEHPAMVTLATGKKITGTILGVYNVKVHDYKWISVSTIPQFREGEKKPVFVHAIFEDVTERLQFEYDLKESKDRYYSMFERISSGVSVYEISEDSVIVKDFNKTAEKLCNVKKSDVIGKPVEDIFTDIDGYNFYKVLRRVWKTGREEYVPPVFYKFPMVERWFDNRIYKLNNDEVVALFDDVTNFKEVEQIIAGNFEDIDIKAGTSFENLFDIKDIQRLQDEFSKATGVSSIITDTEGNFLTEPSNFSDLCKFLSELAYDKCVLCYRQRTKKVEFTEGVDLFECPVSGLLESGAKIMAGNQHVADWLVGQVRTEKTKTTNLLKFAKDRGLDATQLLDLFNKVPCIEKERFLSITEVLTTLSKQLSEATFRNFRQSKVILEKSKIEQNLLTEREFNRTIINNLPGLFYIIDVKTQRILHINEQWSDITGLTSEQIMSMNFIDFFDGKENKKICNNMLKEALGIGYASMENYIRSGEGTEFPYLFSGVVVEMDGKTCLLGSGIDIHDRKVAERETKNLQKRIEQTQRMDSLGQLAGGVAHNFNNLLMGILGYISVLKFDADVSSKHGEKIDAVEEQINRASKLTKALLGFARGGKYDEKIYETNDIVGVSLDLFSNTKRELITHKVFDPSVWCIKVDRSQMEQVLLNMYINALQAMPDGGNLYVETKNVDISDNVVKYDIPPGKYVRISITDEGTGIKKEHLDKIFDPFFTTKEDVGSGMGLASSYGIIENHRGLITVYSEEGKGTTFSIYLPAVDDEDDACNGSEDISISLLAGNGELIAIVDDEHFVSKSTSIMLSRLNYKYKIFNKGEDFLQYLASTNDKVYAVLLDMIMPGMSGAVVFEHIKKIDKNLPVLLMSGYSLNGSTETILNNGCAGFLQKPFFMRELGKKLNDLR